MGLDIPASFISAVTKVGANTLITLANVLKTSLSAANFAFH